MLSVSFPTPLYAQTTWVFFLLKDASECFSIVLPPYPYPGEGEQIMLRILIFQNTLMKSVETPGARYHK